MGAEGGKIRSGFRACQTPPSSLLSEKVGRLYQILYRLVASLTDGYNWFILNILLLAALLTSASLFSPLGYTMSSLANEFEGHETPILEVYVTGDYGEYNEFSNWFLEDIEEYKDQEYFYTKHKVERSRLLTEENATALEEIEGVETVVRALYYDAETTYEQWVTPMELEEREEQLIMEKEEYPARYSFVLNEWESSGVNASLAEFDLKIHSVYCLGMLCVEVGKIDGWALGFNELIEGEMVKPGEALRAAVNSYIVDRSMLIIDREAPVRLLFGHSIDKVDLYFRNDTSHVYDFEIVGVLTHTSRDWGSGSAIDGYINIIVDLQPFMEILQDENHERGVPLPRYTSLYVKPATPMDLPNVEREIKQLLPEAKVKNAGKAPLTISNIAKTSAERYGLLSAGSVLILGAALVSTQFGEAYIGRKQMWLLKAKGWGVLDIVSYTLLRAAVTGVVAGIIAAGILLLAQGKMADSIMLSDIVSTSPELYKVLAEALSDFPAYPEITIQPLMGVTASAITCTIGLLHNLTTKPQSLEIIVSEGERSISKHNNVYRGRP